MVNIIQRIYLIHCNGQDLNFFKKEDFLFFSESVEMNVVRKIMLEADWLYLI